MGTNGDKSFEAMLEGLTPLQLDWVARRIDSRSDREASRLLGIDKDTPGRWKADGVPLDDIIAAAKQDGVILVSRRIRADLNWAYDVKRSGLHSKSEQVRQGAATEILDRGLGKATQRQEVSGPDGGTLVIEYVNDWRTHHTPGAASGAD